MAHRTLTDIHKRGQKIIKDEAARYMYFFTDYI